MLENVTKLTSYFKNHAADLGPVLVDTCFGFKPLPPDFGPGKLTTRLRLSVRQLLEQVAADLWSPWSSCQ